MKVTSSRRHLRRDAMAIFRAALAAADAGNAVREHLAITRRSSSSRECASRAKGFRSHFSDRGRESGDRDGCGGGRDIFPARWAATRWWHRGHEARARQVTSARRAGDGSRASDTRCRWPRSFGCNSRLVAGPECARSFAGRDFGRRLGAAARTGRACKPSSEAENDRFALAGGREYR